MIEFLTLIHFVFLINATGQWVNYSCPLINSINTGKLNSSAMNLGGIQTCLTQNFPWLFPFLTIVIYISLFFFLQDQPGMGKMNSIALIGMIIAIIFFGAGFYGPRAIASSEVVPTYAIVIYGLIFCVDWLTGR